MREMFGCLENGCLVVVERTGLRNLPLEHLEIWMNLLSHSPWETWLLVLLRVKLRKGEAR